MSDTYNYEVLEPGGHARLVGNMLDRISEASANPASAVGSSRAVLGDPETASWMQRTTAADGAALIESICGNTIVESGSLLPVRMEGVETVGFNQWDGTFDSPAMHYLAEDGSIVSNSSWRITDYIDCVGGQQYYVKGYTGSAPAVCWYDVDKQYIAGVRYGEPGLVSSGGVFTVPYNARYLRASMNIGVSEFCINISDPSRNGTYEPYWRSERAIPASTYFPQGMRSAGSVRDELTATQAITRVGERAYQSGDESDASVITDGTVTHYALTTPTTTPIDPPLPMSYRVGAGGTERVMVASGTTSAPPIFVTRYPLDPADLAASIAPVDGPIAKTNHQVGDLLMLGFTLCKATQVIVTGETIEIGTNVTKTSVAAEIAALS